MSNATGAQKRDAQFQPPEPFPIPVPRGDPVFDPRATGDATLFLSRAIYELDQQGVRQQLNEITAFIDGSLIYGNEFERHRALRRLDGSGKLKSGSGELLPFNTPGLPNDGGPDTTLFVAGDLRVNENVPLTCLHTVFLREHNYWCDVVGELFPGSGGEKRFQWARAIVIAEIQAITYEEFLPVLLGSCELEPYLGYRPEVNPSIGNAFSTAAYRFGHSLLSDTLRVVGRGGRPVNGGTLTLQEAFFNPDYIVANGIDPILRGLVLQTAQEIDVQIVCGVRSFLFADEQFRGSDLAARNIQRGRDHGIPGYTQAREALCLRPITAFEQISSDSATIADLRRVYESVDDIDLWVGLLAEDHLRGSLLGETAHAIIRDQFRRLRDGDRFWYEAYLPGPIVKLIKRRSLGRIIAQHTGIGRHLLLPEVFRGPGHRSEPQRKCQRCRRLRRQPLQQ